ncbi:MAG: DnaJ domain-containing protein [Cyanothece sp. SIO1E1]|nr:DnaJ domain-containing protein [Cyanothece sp. SIO1E1]
MAATDFKDYYAILGVSKSATDDEIKRAYRKLARKYHPDLNSGDKTAETRFKEVNEAYEVLSDSEKRQKYDQFGQYWKQAGSGGWPSGGATDFGGFDFGAYGSFDDFINELLGRFGSGPTRGGGQQTYSYRTAPGGAPGFDGFGGFSGFESQPAAANLDLESKIELSLSEAFKGVEKRLRLRDEVINVRIPPGAKPGSKIRVKGKGQADPYTKRRGDVYLIVEIKPHSFFKFEGDNLLCEIPITPDEAVLGGSVEVPTPDGIVTMNIPAGLRSGQSLRLRHKGWPNPKGERGDQLARIIIVTPKELNSIEQDCYEKIRANRSFDPRNHLKQISLE